MIQVSEDFVDMRLLIVAHAALVDFKLDSVHLPKQLLDVLADGVHSEVKDFIGRELDVQGARHNGVDYELLLQQGLGQLQFQRGRDGLQHVGPDSFVTLVAHAPDHRLPLLLLTHLHLPGFENATI